MQLKERKTGMFAGRDCRQQELAVRMTVIEAEGGFVIVDGSPNSSRPVAGPFPTNAEAWRTLDRLEGEPISPAEKRADWISTKILSSGPAPIKPRQTQNAKRQTKKMKRAAAKAPKWLRTGAAATFDPKGNRVYREWQFGTFGAASEVRHIDPADYLAEKNSRQDKCEAPVKSGYVGEHLKNS